MAHRTCSLEDCDREHDSRGLCKMHYKREMTRLARLRSGACGVSSCKSDAVEGGYCADHRYRSLEPLEGESWLPVVGWEGIYEVSDFGRVRSVDRWITHIDGRRVWYPSTIIGLRLGPQGYPRALLCRNSESKWIHLHRLVLEAFVGLRPPGLVACHGNGDPLDNALSNLRWGTYSSNAEDTVRHGRNKNANRTHCSWNHFLQPPNLRMTADFKEKGWRSCLACSRAHGEVRTLRRINFPDIDFEKIADRHYRNIMAAA